MAFYPDELSPIDRIRGLGKPPDLSDIKSRRQWKSLVLGKKDLGMTSFATIAEEKEEEISSDGSQGPNSSKDNSSTAALQDGVVANKKITFPKPRKYITSRVSDRKEGGSSGERDCCPSYAASKAKSLAVPEQRKATVGDAPPLSAANPLKSNIHDMRQILKTKKSRELVPLEEEFVANYVLSEIPIQTQWNEAVMEASRSMEKGVVGKSDSAQPWKPQQEEKKKSGGNAKASSAAESFKREPKTPKSKSVRSAAKSGKAGKASTINPLEKGKTLNMKDVVNVYKNLAYGSKEEIKSFVEKLSFVKDETKTESDKNLLSVMNLKALENRIKNFTRKSVKGQEQSTSKEKKPSGGRAAKKNRKAHIDRLARHKVIKVPAALNDEPRKSKADSIAAVKKTALDKRCKRSTAQKVKEPWKYVGMQSILDKTYFVYPAYPPSVNSKTGVKGEKVKKAKKGEIKKGEIVAKDKAAEKADLEPKVKAPQVVLRQNSLIENGAREKISSGTGARSSNALSISASNKSMNRPSATTVCTVEFRPMGPEGQKTSLAAEPGPTDQSLLVYLHGTKAINVRSPYSDKQFSRVKVLRKDDRGAPLIKGLARRAQPKISRDIFVRNIRFPETFSTLRPLDLLDFEEDIQNITDFLRSQSSSRGHRQEDRETLKKSETWAKESPDDEPAVTAAAATDTAAPQRHHRRQRRSNDDQLRRHHHQYQNHHHHHHHNHHHHHHHHHHQHQHQHGTSQETLLSDSIIHELSKNIHHLQYLPDTEENRKMIAWFFDELDRRIEASRNGDLLGLPEIPSYPASFRPIPILGY